MKKTIAKTVLGMAVVWLLMAGGTAFAGNGGRQGGSMDVGGITNGGMLDSVSKIQNRTAVQISRNVSSRMANAMAPTPADVMKMTGMMTGQPANNPSFRANAMAPDAGSDMRAEASADWSNNGSADGAWAGDGSDGSWMADGSADMSGANDASAATDAANYSADGTWAGDGTDAQWAAAGSPDYNNNGYDGSGMASSGPDRTYNGSYGAEYNNGYDGSWMAGGGTDSTSNAGYRADDGLRAQPGSLMPQVDMGRVVNEAIQRVPDQMQGRMTNQIADRALTNLRTNSASLRQIRRQVRDGIMVDRFKTIYPFANTQYRAIVQPYAVQSMISQIRPWEFPNRFRSRLMPKTIRQMSGRIKPLQKNYMMQGITNPNFPDFPPEFYQGQPGW